MKVSTLVGLSNAVAIETAASPILTEASSNAMDRFTDATESEFTVEDHQRMILNLLGALSLRDLAAARKVEETLQMHYRMTAALVILGTGGQDDPE